MEFPNISKIAGPILITGHTGFKGSWLRLLLNELGIDHVGYSLQAQPESLGDHLRYELSDHELIGDVRDIDSLRSFAKRTKPSIIIHLAAQPLVLDSYDQPLETFSVNVMGTANVLEVALAEPSVSVVLVITTDKVYVNKGDGKRYRETDPLGGKDPYSASKVAAEWVCESYRKLIPDNSVKKIITARAGNVVGGGDFSRNRLLPDVIRAVTNNQHLVVRNPNSTRPWQHVLDPLFGYLRYIDAVLERDLIPGALNFGPNDGSASVYEIVKVAEEHYQGRLKVEFSNESAPREEKSLELDSSLASTFLGWRSKLDPRTSTIWTLDWWDSVNNNRRRPLEVSRENLRNFLQLN